MAPGTGLPVSCQGSMCLSFPARETVEQMMSMKPAGFRASMARDGHLRGLGKAKADPPGPGRPPHSQGTKSTASHQSSLTSLEGSGVSERLPRKSLRQAGGPHVEVGVHGGHGLRTSGSFLPLGMPAPIAASHSPANIRGLCPMPPLCHTFPRTHLSTSSSCSSSEHL